MLIVEDHAKMRAALRDFLQSVYPAVEIFEAANGAEACELCRAHEVGVVLLDIGLPDVNGIDLIAPIRSLRPDCVVLVVSQHANPAYADAARAAGAAGYITKDAIFSKLAPAIDRALSSRA